MSKSDGFLSVASLLKRVKNITKGVTVGVGPNEALLVEPAEHSLIAALGQAQPAVRDAAERGDYRKAFAEIAALQPSVATFFEDVLVMADDEALRTARLAVVARLRDLILDIADISEIVTE
jgi:glycyl-tRNA synthetase beta chain